MRSTRSSRGVGEAILAFLPQDEAEAIIEANASLYPRYHSLDAGRVRSQLPEIRAKRYALDDGELVAGISALAVPILPQGRDAVAAIAINMTSTRLQQERLVDLVAMLRQEVRRVEDVINPLEGALRVAGCVS